MKRDIALFFILVFILTAFTGSGQSYVVEYFEEKYDTLDTYTSICNENAKNAIEPFFFAKEFEFGFDFPFFGKTYSKVYFENDGVGIFEGSVQYNFYLFTSLWNVYYWNDPFRYESARPVESDWRYTHSTRNGKKVLIIEHRHVAPFVFDTKASPYNGGDVNFQQWFWENGDIEVRFGDIHIDSTLFKGAMQDPIDSTFYTLAIGIQNYENTQQMFIEGTINNFVLTKFDDENSLDSLPKPNTGVRFKYMPVNTKDTPNQEKNKIYVEGEVLHLDQDQEFDTFCIYNLSGQLVQSGIYEKEIDISQLASGMYVLQQKSKTINQSMIFVKM